MKRKFSPAQLLRHLVQLAAFLLFPGLFIAIFSALKSVVTALFAGSFSWAAMSYDLAVLAAVLPVTLLWGRFFCGWLCSFGAVSDLLSALARLVFKRRPAIGPRADSILKYLKYLLLAAIVVVIWILGIAPDSAWNPWHIFGLYSRPQGYGTGAIVGIGGGLLAAILLLEFFFDRFFCRYLCPLGAVFALLARGNLLRLCRTEACVSCGLCDRACPMGNPVSKKARVPSGECIGCARCGELCPSHALHTPGKHALHGLAAAALIIALYLGGTALSAYIPVPLAAAAEPSAATPMAVSPGVAAELAADNLADGVYTGSGSGYRGQTTVEVVVSGGRIESITVTDYQDDYRFFTRAESALPAAIIDAQSLEVSAVTGATFSSNSILEAVANALDQPFENPNSTLSRGHHHGGSGEGEGSGEMRRNGKAMQAPASAEAE